MPLFLTTLVAFIIKHRKIFITIGILFLLFLVIGLFNSYFQKPVKIDQQTIQKINSENENERKTQLEQVIRSNSDIIQTADNRSVIAQQNIEQRNADIKNKVDAVDAKIEQIKKEKGVVTSQELQCILMPNDCQ